jgi:hypothetical protein
MRRKNNYYWGETIIFIDDERCFLVMLRLKDL